MNLDEACISCIKNQALRVCDTIKADKTLRTQIIAKADEMAKEFSFEKNPPQVATPLYEEMARLAHKRDLYDEVKKESTLQAKKFIPYLQEQLQNSSEKLLTATKIAIAGNVIDLAAEVSFDLDEQMAKIFETHFSKSDFLALQSELEKATTLMYLADNAGEHLFDYLYIETLQQLYPHLQITYVVRGKPIINDVTYEEAKEFGFAKLCTLLDSGVPTPGFDYMQANSEAQKLFDEADLIIAKGMGNYECLTPYPRENICFLLKVKCQVVANAIGHNIGDIVCKVV